MTPRSGLKFGGPNPPGYRGNRLVSVDWSWRQLEPEEGRFEFEPLRQAIRQAARQGDGIELHIKGSVWELRHFPSEANYPGNWKAHIESSATAPSSALGRGKVEKRVRKTPSIQQKACSLSVSPIGV